MGTKSSLFVHTIVFVIAILLMFFFDFEKVLLTLTTLLSLEAIYLSLFIQMTVNKQQEHVEDILEDTSELTEE